ncbi:unnamed protein product, partial [Rotaria socialis]
WLYPQPAPLNQLDQSWQSPYSGQAGQQQTPRQPNQTAKPGSPLVMSRKLAFKITASAPIMWWMLQASIT